MAATIRILKSFRGDPENAGAAEVMFRAGETVDVSDEFAALIVAKGLAEVVGAAPAPTAPKPQPIPSAPKV